MLHRLTVDETNTITLFNRSTPSVVSSTNLATRRDAFTLNMLEIPQGAGSGFVWDRSGHIVTVRTRAEGGEEGARGVGRGC